jgi:cell division initiation protein
MEVSPKTFREVEFREKMRGYHPEDVDQFLEQMATAVEAINERLQQADERVHQADERVQRAEAAAAEAGNSDETLRRTLVLAQRTADLAVQEAREQASQLVASAEQQAQGIMSEAEDRARRLHGEALADVHAELAKLEATRAQAQQEVDALSRWATEHRAHLTASLREALAQIDKAGLLTPPPSSSPIDVPTAAPRPTSHTASAALPPAAEASAPADRSPADRAPAERSSAETRTRDRAPADGGQATQAVPAAAKAPASESGGLRADGDRAERAAPAGPATPNEEGVDDLFDNGEFDNGPRFGGRLRRRH